MEDFKYLAQIITTLRLCACDMHDTTSRSWLVKGEKVHMFTAEGDLAVLQTVLFIL
jgi:hypothetical protein